MSKPPLGTPAADNPVGYSTKSVRRLTAFGMAVALSMLVLGTLMLVDARSDAKQEADRASDNLVLALARDMGRNIAVFDLSVQGVIDALRLPGVDQLSPELRQTALFDRAATAEYLGSILVLDTNGIVIEESTSPDPHRLDFSDRDYFQVHKDSPDVGLFVSRPYSSRLRHGDASIAISRRLTRPNGQFGGVVMGALRLAYFRSLFSTLKLGTRGSVTLFRSDGVLLARYPEVIDDVGRNFADATVVKAFAREANGRIQGKSAVDGITREFVFRQIGDMPLILTVGSSVDDIYSAWRHKAVVIGSVLAVLCTATVVLCLMFRQEMLRRLKAEEALLDAAEKLSVIAATDSLTGLANRRAFETELNAEWRRAIRAETELSLLMLDADCFKPFNDHYGHQEGDRVLQAIAGCIDRGIRRPGDVGARYGGEEFVALLPETNLAGAMAIAERIRTAVADLAIPHQGSDYGRVTISAGVASAHPTLGSAESTIVKAADEALYDAKRSGRNRVVVAEEPPAPALSPATAPRVSQPGD